MVTPESFSARRYFQSAAILRIEPGGGLVEEEQARVVHQRLRKIEALAHPSREGAGPALGHVGEVDDLEQLVGFGRRRSGGEPVEPTLEHEVLVAGEVVIDAHALSGVADPMASLLRLLRHVDAVHHHPARRGSQQGHPDADGGGLPRSVGAEEAEYLSFFYTEADAVHRSYTARIDLHQVVGFEYRHRGCPPSCRMVRSERRPVKVAARRVPA